MATINVGGFGFGKHFKTLEEAINNPNTMDSDTIVIHKKHLVMTMPAKIDKTLYIQGNDVQITVKQGQAGMIITNGDLRMSDVHFNLPPQANAMVFDAMYSGTAELENITTEHNKCKLREIYPSVKVTASKGQPASQIAMNNCDIDYFDGELKVINLTNSIIGRIYKPQSNIVAYDFSASQIELDNVYLSNANKAIVDSLKTAGQLAINGHFNFNNTEIINKGIDIGSHKETNDYYKAQKLINDAVHSQLANKTNVLFNVFGDQKFSSAVRLENVKFPSEKPFYLRQLLAGKYSAIVIKNAKIPVLDLPSNVANGNLSLENTVDKSQWETQNVDIANRQSVSSLFVSKRKVDGITSMNGSLADLSSGAVQQSSALEQLDSLIGLESVKKFVHKMVDSAATDAYLAKRGLGQTKTHYLHTVLSGNQGTGKTMVAHIMARALYQKGVLPTNKFRAVKASMLLGQYNGETRQKTRKVMQDAMDGVLFIDEAYGLAHQANSNDNYGDQAVEEIIQDMENAKGRIMVIMAGYTQNMQDFFRTSNPGLTSRFVNWCQFPDYTPKQMLEILQFQLDHTPQHWHLADNDAVIDLRSKFLKAIEPGSGVVGNGRFCRTVTEKLTDQAKARIAGYGLEKMQQMSDNELTSITVDDIDKTMPAIMQQQAQMHGIGI